MKCTFFGHRNTINTVIPILKRTLIDLIENYGVDTFYVGNQGNFDYFVKKTLKELKVEYPHITYYIVLAYMPGTIKEDDPLDYLDTIYPDGLESVPRKYAISKRNEWMIQQSDIVISYTLCYAGGAGKFTELSKKKGKIVINLAELLNKDN